MVVQFWNRATINLTLALGIALALTSGVLVLAWSSQTAPPMAGNPISFSPATPVFTLTEDVTALTWADLDRDGAADLAFAVGNEMRIAANTAASPTNWMPPMLVESGLGQINALLAADLDRDAHTDLVAFCGDEGGGRVRTWRNPGDPFVTGWNERGNVAQSATIAYPTGAVGDLDGDAAPDLIVGGNDGILRLWRNPMAPGNDFTVDWGAPIEITLGEVPEAVQVADVNRDGRLDLLVAVGDALRIWENPGTPFDAPWTNAVTLSGQGSALQALFVADLDGDGRPDPVAGDAGGNLLAWSNPITPGHTLVADWPSPATIGALGEPISALTGGDFDHDGQMDLAGGGAGPTYTVQAWHNNRGLLATWDARTLGARNDTVYILATTDVDIDGDLDLLAGIGDGDSTQTALWTNNLIHREARFAETASPIGESGTSVEVLVQGDLDRDGRPDLVSGNAAGEIVLREYTGDSMTHTWSTHVVSDTQPVIALALSDLDGDGDLEIVSGHAAPPRILIWRNRGTSLDGPWSSTPVGAPAARVGALTAADLDRDGRPDLVSGSGVYTEDPNQNHKVTIWRNDGTPFDGTWPFTDAAVISYTVNAVAAGDLDRDGWPDIVVGTQRAPAVGSADNPVPRAQWPDVFQLHALRNPGAPFEGPWPRTAVGRDPTTVTLGPEENPSHYHGYWGATVYDLQLADFDRDGDLDIVTADHIEADYQVKVWENDGTPFDGQPKTFHWTWQPVAVWYGRPPSPPWMGGSALTVDVADFNLDGWPDVVPGLTNWLWVWFENTRHPFGTAITDTHWLRRQVAPGLIYNQVIATNDYDRDGDPDIATGSDAGEGPSLNLWPNWGGGVCQQASATKSSPMQQGTTDDLLKINLRHNGHNDEDDVQLVNWRLRFTGPQGLPLETEEADALIDTLWVYRDTGNNRWGMNDTPLITITNPALSGGDGTLMLDDGGYQTLEFDDDPNTVVPPGGTATFFVVVALTDTAMYQTPNAFQLWFDANSDSLIEEANRGATVAVCDAAPVSSELIQVVGPPTHVLIEEAADGTGSEVEAPAVASGYSLDFHAIGRDELEQYVTSLPVTWTLTPLTGGILPEDLIPSLDTRQARLHGHLTGTARVSIEHTSLGTDTTGIISVAPAPASMSLSTDPAAVTANGVSTTTLLASLEDAHGVSVVDGVPVTFTIVNGTKRGSLPSAPCIGRTVNGQAMTTFQAGTKTGTVTFQASTGGLTNQFTITLQPGQLAAFDFGGYPTTIYAGWAFYQPPLVTALDAFGNVKTDYRGSVYFTASDSQATFSYTMDAPYTFTTEDMGQHRFDGNAFVLGSAGFQTITVTDGAIAATTAPITVRPGLDLGRIELSVSSRVITAGLPVTCAVEAFDTYGNSRGDWTPQCHYSIEREAGGQWEGNVYTSERDGTWHIGASAGYDPPRYDTVELKVVFVGHRAYLPLVVRRR